MPTTPATAHQIATLFSVPADTLREAKAHVHEILDAGAEMIGRDEADAIMIRVMPMHKFVTVATYRRGVTRFADQWSAHDTEAEALDEYRRHVEAGAYTCSVAMVLHSTDY